MNEKDASKKAKAIENQLCLFYNFPKDPKMWVRGIIVNALQKTKARTKLSL